MIFGLFIIAVTVAAIGSTEFEEYSASYSIDIANSNPCFYLGEMFWHGVTWEPLPCATCTCNNRNSECTIKTCPTCDGNAKAPKKNDCCGKCDGERVQPTETSFCSWRDVIYNDQEEFSLNPCTDCTCDGGTSYCVVRSCPPPPCKSPKVVAHECCPVCGTGAAGGI